MIMPPGAGFVHQAAELYQGRNLLYSARPCASTSGILRFLAKPGDTVSPGQAIARIYNAFGKCQETIKSMESGIILGHTDSSAAFPGMPVMAFGIGDRQSLG